LKKPGLRSGYFLLKVEVQPTKKLASILFGLFTLTLHAGKLNFNQFLV